MFCKLKKLTYMNELLYNLVKWSDWSKTSNKEAILYERTALRDKVIKLYRKMRQALKELKILLYLVHIRLFYTEDKHFRCLAHIFNLGVQSMFQVFGVDKKY